MDARPSTVTVPVAIAPELGSSQYQAPSRSQPVLIAPEEPRWYQVSPTLVQPVIMAPSPSR